MATERDAIDDYLARLERAAQVLPPDRRAELLAEIREHIAEAGLSEGAAKGGEAATRSLLDRLGTPEEIVEAAAEGGSTAPQRYLPPRPHPSRALEIWAVVMLTAGSVLLPVVGWLVGVVLLWSSNRWRTREKLLGTLVVPGGLGAVLITLLVWVGFGVSTTSCFQSSSAPVDGSGQPITTSSGSCDDGSSWTQWLGAAGAIVVVLAALIVPFVLLHVANKRAESELNRPQPAPLG